ncbi:hypothetical protein PM082_020212 [Marasmius tenuissimus]|nr:hypothetical protein PM082_020212 [Marasmius tenuissimus]
MSPNSDSPPTRPTFIFSDLSSDPVPKSVWASTEFMLAAGMVVIQPSTKKWTLPHGRKHIGEPPDLAAVRIACEETRYKVDAMPLYLCSRQTLPSSDRNSKLSTPRLITEAFCLSLTSWETCIEPNGGFTDGGGEGVVLWYMGCIASVAMTVSQISDPICILKPNHRTPEYTLGCLISRGTFSSAPKSTEI